MNGRQNSFIARCTILMIILSFPLRQYTKAEIATCYSHDDCLNTSEFCGWSTCVDPYAREYRCAECTGCSNCKCDWDSIDGSCPRTRCPGQPSSAVRFLQGAFYNETEIFTPIDFVCMRRLSFSGSTFSDIQAH